VRLGFPESMEDCKYGRLKVWKYGSMEVWKYGSMEVLSEKLISDLWKMKY
jgi:hypothetical protein